MAHPLAVIRYAKIHSTKHRPIVRMVRAMNSQGTALSDADHPFHQVRGAFAKGLIKRCRC